MAPPGAQGGPNGEFGHPRGMQTSQGQFLGHAQENRQACTKTFPTTYQGYTFRKVPQDDLPPGEKVGWKNAHRTEMPVSSDELEKRLRERRLKTKRSVSDEFMALTSENQKAQVNRLVEEKKMEEENPYAEWKLASVETKINQVGRKTIETITINVILQRQPKESLGAQNRRTSGTYAAPRHVNLDDPIQIRENRPSMAPRDSMPSVASRETIPQMQQQQRPPMQQPMPPPSRQSMPQPLPSMPPDFGPLPPPQQQQPMQQPMPLPSRQPMPQPPPDMLSDFGPLPPPPPPGPPQMQNRPPGPPQNQQPFPQGRPTPPPGLFPGQPPPGLFSGNPPPGQHFQSAMRVPPPGAHPGIIPNQGRPIGMQDRIPIPPPPGVFLPGQPGQRQPPPRKGSAAAEVVLTDSSSDDDDWQDVYNDPDEIVNIIDNGPKKHRGSRGRSPAVETVRMKHKKSRSRSVGRTPAHKSEHGQHHDKGPRRRTSRTYIKETTTHSERNPTKSPRRKDKDWDFVSVGSSSDNSEYRGRAGSSQFSDAGGSDFTAQTSHSGGSRDQQNHRCGSLHRTSSDEERHRHRVRERVHQKPPAEAPSPPRHGRSPHRYSRGHAGQPVDIIPGYGYPPRVESRPSIRARTPERPILVSYGSYPAEVHRYINEPRRLEASRPHDLYPWEAVSYPADWRRKEDAMAEHVLQNDRAAYHHRLEQERRHKEKEAEELMRDALRREDLREERIRQDERDRLRREERLRHENVMRGNISRPLSRGALRYADPLYPRY